MNDYVVNTFNKQVDKLVNDVNGAKLQHSWWLYTKLPVYANNYNNLVSSYNTNIQQLFNIMSTTYKLPQISSA